MHYLHLVYMRDEHGHWFMNILFIRDPPNNQSIAFYLVINCERLPNALLSTGLLPLTSTHLFWK
jgi:hypothetical protein